MKGIIPEKPRMVIEQRKIQKRDWEEILSDGMEAREAKDNSQWVLGDLAVEIEVYYGPGMLGEFASKIGVNKGTLKRYATVSKAWLPKDRLSFCSHRHHQVLAGRKDRKEWLKKAHDNSWNVEGLGIELKKAAGEWDEKLAVASMSLARGEIEEVLRWYRQIFRKWPEKLNTFSRQVNEKMKLFLKKTEKGGN